MHYGSEELREEIRDAFDAMGRYVPRPAWGEKFRSKIRPGVYDIGYGLSENSEPMALKVRSDELYVFRDGPADALRMEMREFWSKAEAYAEKKLIHRRGILVSGPPGSGKTSILTQEAANLARKGQVVFLAKHPYSIQEAVHKFRKLEPYRELTVIIEDIDEITKSWGEQPFLEMFDGSHSVDHVLFIATTNNPEKLSPKLRRPGRFDRKIEVPAPSKAMRSEYVRNKFGGDLSVGQQRRLVEMTDGMGFGHLRAIVVSLSGYGLKLEEAVAEVRDAVLTEAKGLDQKGCCEPECFGD